MAANIVTISTQTALDTRATLTWAWGIPAFNQIKDAVKAAGGRWDPDRKSWNIHLNAIESLSTALADLDDVELCDPRGAIRTWETTKARTAGARLGYRLMQGASASIAGIDAIDAALETEMPSPSTTIDPAVTAEVVMRASLLFPRDAKPTPEETALVEAALARMPEGASPNHVSVGMMAYIMVDRVIAQIAAAYTEAAADFAVPLTYAAKCMLYDRVWARTLDEREQLDHYDRLLGDVGTVSYDPCDHITAMIDAGTGIFPVAK